MRSFYSNFIKNYLPYSIKLLIAAYTLISPFNIAKADLGFNLLELANSFSLAQKLFEADPNQSLVLKKTYNVTITFSDADLNKCSSLGKIQNDMKNTFLKNDCYPLERLKDEARLRNGNLVLINTAYSGCDLRKYNAQVFYCKTVKDN